MLGPDKKLENKGWEQMSKTLDKELPRKKRRPFFLWFSLGIIALLATFYFGITELSISDRSKRVVSTKQKSNTDIHNEPLEIAKNQIKKNALKESEFERINSVDINQKETRNTQETIKNDRIKNQLDSRGFTNSENSEVKVVADLDNGVDQKKKAKANRNKSVDVFKIEDDHSSKVEHQPSFFEIKKSQDSENIFEIKTAQNTREVQSNVQALSVLKKSGEKLSSNLIDNRLLASPEIDVPIKSKRDTRQSLRKIAFLGSGLLVNSGLGFELGGGIQWNEGRFFFRPTLGLRFNRFGSMNQDDQLADNEIIVREEINADGGEFNNFGLTNTSDLLKSSTIINMELMIGHTLLSNLDLGLGFNVSRVLNYSSVSGEVQFTNGDLGPIQLERNGYVGSQSFFEEFDYGISANLEYALSRKFKIALRYNHGLKPLVENGTTTSILSSPTTQMDFSIKNINRSVDLRLYYSF